jgi:Mg2+ and Co2+ transporter CorA
LKEAHAVEKLTRITVLLAKATIMFLPVSLMTGYYSTQLADLQGIYTARTYWLSFLVTAVLTFLFLLAFGFMSDSVEGKVVYRSLTRTLWDRRSRKHSS